MTGELRTASTSCLLFLLISISPRTSGPFIQHGLALILAAYRLHVEQNIE